MITNAHILVDRYYSNSTVTLSKVSLSFDGGITYRVICDGLEDPYHDVKIWGNTRIPEGTYDVTLRRKGGMFKRYLKRFWFHEGMLWVRNVPNFKFIYLHTGNKPIETEGCLLVGFANKQLNRVYSSVKAYRKLYLAVLPYAKDGKLNITFIDNDRLNGQKKSIYHFTLNERKAIKKLIG